MNDLDILRMPAPVKCVVCAIIFFALSAPIRGDINQAKYNAYFLQTAWQAKNRGYDVLLLTGEDAVADIRARDAKQLG